MNCILFHDWARWSEPQKSQGGLYFSQSRACKGCGKIEVREIVAQNTLREVLTEGYDIAIYGDNK
jgi:hypothetical protein